MKKQIYIGLLGVIFTISSCQNSNNKMNPSEKSQLSENEHLLFVGAYTRNEGFVDGKAEGIYVLKFNDSTGDLTGTKLKITTTNPSYLSVNSNTKRIYAVNEIADNTQKNGGASIKAFSYDIEKSEINELNGLDAMGGAPCYIMEYENHIFTANYVGGNHAVYDLDENGALKSNTQVINNQGKGIKPQQGTAHAHMMTKNPYTNQIFGVDLGTDTIKIFNFIKDRGILEQASAIALTPGSGPRHIDFHPTKNIVYVLNELGGSVNVFEFKNGNYESIQNITSTTNPNNQDASCADIHIHPNGKYLYVSNRGPFNSITLYQIQENGTLKLVSERSSNGQVPRSFIIDPTGKFVLVANQNSNNIAVFKIDEQSGRLLDTEKGVDVPTPVCLKFE